MLGTAAFVVLVCIVGLGYFSPFAQDPITRGVYPALFMPAGVIVVAIALIVSVLQPFSIRVRPVLPILTAIFSTLMILVPITFWYLGRDGLAYQFFQGMRIGTAPFGFGDLQVTLSWLDCVRSGEDPYDPSFPTCPPGGPANYGPAFLWLEKFGFTSSQSPVIGVLLVLATGLALFWLSRFSNGLGSIAVLAVAVSPAWLLLLERANFDVLVVISAVFLVWIVRRMPGIWGWVIGAVPIWVLGSWKYYPFAMVLALVPALRLRGGWALVSGFIITAIAYLAIFRETVLWSLESNAALSGGNLWGIGRDVLAALVGGQEKSDTAWRWPDVLIGLLLLLGLIWGWCCANGTSYSCRSPGRFLPLTTEAMVAIGGAVGVLVSIAVGGFGYLYKAALLIVAIPLLARMGQRGSPPVWRSCLAMLLFVVIGNIFVWNLAISSFATMLAAAFACGAALQILLRYVIPKWGLARRSAQAPV